MVAGERWFAEEQPIRAISQVPCTVDSESVDDECTLVAEGSHMCEEAEPFWADSQPLNTPNLVGCCLPSREAQADTSSSVAIISAFAHFRDRCPSDDEVTLRLGATLASPKRAQKPSSRATKAVQKRWAKGSLRRTA